MLCDDGDDNGSDGAIIVDNDGNEDDGRVVMVVW